jgi:hypothetical protein
MVNGLKVPSRLETLKHRGTLERSDSGCVDWPSKGVGVATLRDLIESGRGNPETIVVESTGEKSSVGSFEMSVPETDTGG